MSLTEHHAVPVRKGPPRPQDAISQIPAAASAYEMTGEDEIGDTLTQLAESGDAITMYVPGQREVVLGRILSVDPEQPHFVMELNEGMSLEPGKVTFVTWMRSAKLQFRLSSKDWRALPGQPQLIPMDFPETCSVLNRRATERVEVPLGATCLATFVINVVNNTHNYELPIFDLSLGGISMHCSKLNAKGLIKGRKVHGVVLELGDETVEVEELEVRYTRPFRSFLLGEQVHLGCMFTKLAPEQESKLKLILEQISADLR
ncbi:MAG TPA: flagellar regulator YcgR PilZN domain-containing protein [Burkholderiaceae bacterium]|nr:flagellar regulator YcgR PilZN domain-containing protein [Burkholderiaceae bacterium]